MIGRSAAFALALLGCSLTTPLDGLQSGAGGMSGNATNASAGGGTPSITVLAEGVDAPDAIAIDDAYVDFSTGDAFI